MHTTLNTLTAQLCVAILSPTTVGAGWNKFLQQEKENPLDSNHAVLMIFNWSQSLDSHSCGELILGRLLKSLKTSL